MIYLALLFSSILFLQAGAVLLPNKVVCGCLEVRDFSLKSNLLAQYDWYLCLPETQNYVSVISKRRRFIGGLIKYYSSHYACFNYSILISGDVHPHPGPAYKKSIGNKFVEPKPKCNTCGKTVRCNQKKVGCCECGLVFHIKCISTSANTQVYYRDSPVFRVHYRLFLTRSSTIR